MGKECYVPKRFNSGSRVIIKLANEIIAEYMAEGMTLTLRQLYYQFVSREMLANKQTEYKRLGNIISDARLAGLVDWLAIEDRARHLQGNSHWLNPGHIIDNAVEGFKLDHWDGQETRVEVWVEKEALIGVIGDICQELDVDFFACKGYVSQSEMWAAANRFKRYREAGASPVIVHLGDHDPSGIDMTRDIEERQDIFGGSYQIERHALNMNQIKKHKPPPNPAKVTDSRFDSYLRKYGEHSWELDALEPRMLKDVIRKAVESKRDDGIYQDVLKLEKLYKGELVDMAADWRDPKDVKTVIKADCRMCPLKGDSEEEHF